MSYPSPLLAEKLDREALDGMYGRLAAKSREAPVKPPPEKPRPKPKPPEPVHDGSDRMSEWLRSSAIAAYCWMVETELGEVMG